FVMLYNPLDEPVQRTVKLPLYYTGLKKVAKIREKESASKVYNLNRDYSVEIPVTIAAHGFTWFVIE
ncbi:MAG: hypothetical protein ABI091_13640, partial [Ferruginibacter sp.]